MRYPLHFIPPAMRVPILQGRLKGKKWITGSSNHGCWLGSYEYDKQFLFEKKIKRGSVVYDVGANVGFYTLLASELVGPDGQVVAFEPVPRNLFYLKEHLRLNQVTNVTIIEAAVSDRVGVAFFAEGPSNSMGHLAPQGSLEVHAITLDLLVFNQQIPIPDYIKIDVEGAEMMVLRGAQKVLIESHPKLFLATHNPSIHLRCCEYLQALGYQLSAIPDGSIEETDEIFAYCG